MSEERGQEEIFTSKGRSSEGTRELSSCEQAEADADLSWRRTLKLMFRVTGSSFDRLNGTRHVA